MLERVETGALGETSSHENTRPDLPDLVVSFDLDERCRPSAPSVTGRE